VPTAPSRRRDRLADLDPYVERCLKDWHIPGLAVAVLQDNEMIYAKGFGLCELGRGEAVTDHTRFYIGSCTKSFTTAAIGLLVEEGTLAWDRPVRDFLPWFRLLDPVATERATIRDLLTHNTGVPRHDMLWVTSEATRRETCGLLRHLPASKDLRGGYQYNNLMYMTAGQLIEEVSGQSWEEFVRTRFLQPLGMNRTGFCPELVNGGEDCATGHTEVRGRMVPWPRAARQDPHTNIGPCSPGGAIFSDVHDMCQWLRLHLGRGRVGRRRLLREATVRELHSPQVVIPGPPEWEEWLDGSYALGWAVQPYRGQRWIGHSGSLSGFNSNMSFMREVNAGVMCLTNVGSSPVAGLVPLAIYDRLLGLEPVDWNARAKRKARAAKAAATRAGKTRPVRGTQPSHPLAHYAGEYRHPGYGPVHVALEGEVLKLRYHRLTFRLRHYHYDQFAMRGEPHGTEDTRVTFRLDDRGRVAGVAIAFEPAVADIEFAKL
jgi:CubicO group peptidase (beta-lactamase class C family)